MTVSGARISTYRRYSGRRQVVQIQHVRPRGPADAQGWREFHPIAAPVEFFTLRPDEGELTFTAPWGERMVARPRDVIVRNPRDHNDVYRIYWVSFACTYEVTRAPVQ